MMRTVLFAVFLSAQTLPAAADKAELVLLLTNLYSAKDPCKLEYNEAAVEAYTKQRVSKGDKAVWKLFELAMTGKTMQMLGISKEDLAAFCSQVEQEASNLGFMKQ